MIVDSVYDHSMFINVVKQSFENYLTFGKRSSKKMLPIHNYLADVMSSVFGSNYEVYCMERNREYKVTGKYYDKNVDIAVVKNNTPVMCLGVKFITSNYKQNANNYFEAILGETANVQSMENIPYAHMMVFRRNTPYYDASGNIKKIETLHDEDMRKYIKLMFDLAYLHKPFGLGISIVDIEDTFVSESDYYSIFSTKVADVLTNTLSNKKLFQDIIDRKIYLDYKTMEQQ
jgi:hypothetical protein